MTKRILTVNGTTYKTQKALMEVVREKISTLKTQRITKNHSEFLFFSDFFQYHPDATTKFGCGVKSFFIEYPAVYIERTDDTRDLISYKGCLTPKKQNLNVLSDAFRTAISPYTTAYRNSQPNTCVYCFHECVLPKEKHVDHIYPFSKIRDKFLEQNRLPVPQSFGNTECRNHYITFFSQDEEFESAWIKFHNDTYPNNYQILCDNCNSKKTNKVGNSPTRLGREKPPANGCFFKPLR